MSPATKHKIKLSSVLNNKLLIIAPTSQSKAIAASFAVLAEFLSTITSKDWLKSLRRYNKIFAAAGHPNCVFEIDFMNIQKITNGKIEDIIE